MSRVTQHPEIVVQVRRGGVVESQHRAVAALAGPDGEIVERWGDPGMVTFWRSSAKPLQAQAWLADGTIERFGWGAEELAIMSASHDGLDFQAGLVRRMLADLGLTEADLRCDATLKARHNCSGNHTGMLAGCVHHGWDVATYQASDHPAQRAGVASVAEASGVSVEDMPLAVDGCGIVVMATPVAAAARAYARLPRLAPRIAAAMQAHPVLVEGEGELDTVVMQSFPGTVSKVGAEGLGCVALPQGGAVAVKVLDGGDRAVEPALIALLVRHLALDDVPAGAAALARPVVRNDAGAAVGELVARLPK
ncbi:MAG TPA: asparaginase [Thermoleophilia bacterium]|nr:asparaginase [Thermoleophilia bacterium]